MPMKADASSSETVFTSCSEFALRSKSDGWSRVARRKAELTRRFQRDRGTITEQGDQFVDSRHAFPAKAGQAFEQDTNALRNSQVSGRQVIQAEAEFLVFGTDAPATAGFSPGGDVVAPVVRGG